MKKGKEKSTRVDNQHLIGKDLPKAFGDREGPSRGEFGGKKKPETQRPAREKGNLGGGVRWGGEVPLLTGTRGKERAFAGKTCGGGNLRGEKGLQHRERRLANPIAAK